MNIFKQSRPVAVEKNGKFILFCQQFDYSIYNNNDCSKLKDLENPQMQGTLIYSKLFYAQLKHYCSHFSKFIYTVIQTIQKYRMNSREISELFTSPNEQDFNPIETFGNRNSASSLPNKSDNPRARHEGDRQARDDCREETRIKLLSSYQESYLQSVSQPMFTEQDQPSEIRANDRTNLLTYSESKRSANKMDRYLNTDSMLDGLNDHDLMHMRSRVGRAQVKINEKRSDMNQAQTQQQRYADPDHVVMGTRKEQAAKDKIKVLSIAIEEEQYELSVQQRLYSFLMTRLQERNRVRKLRDNQQLVQRAIDFMDSGDQFMKELIKLSKMQQT